MDIEGCLSIPGVFGKVERFKSVKIKYQDLKGKQHEEEVNGFLARVIQHEYDHLEGILFIDKAIETFTEEELRKRYQEEDKELEKQKIV